MAGGGVRVLHLCAGNLYGGVERIVAECVIDRGLCPDMQPAVAVCFDGRLSAEVDAAGVPCSRLGAVRASRPWTVLRARRRLARVLQAERPDTVVCHSSWSFALAAPVVRRLRCRLVLWLHDRVAGRTWPERLAARTRPDAIITNSRFTDASVPALYTGASSTVLYAPVPAEEGAGDRGALRAAAAVDPDTAVIVIASRFEPWKGHELLLAALAQVTEPWQLWIAGSAQRAGEQARVRALEAQVRAAGLAGRVTFLGERRDVAACMRAADIHCQPNTGPEPFGLAFVEALYAGLPVVTTAMGGALEIVTNACGVLVPPGDASALAAALRTLIRSREARTRLGAAGPARARELCDPARQLAALARIVHLPAGAAVVA